MCQHYWPEPFNTADVCEELARRGHEVTVVTALPNTGMPGNDIPAEWRGPARCDEVRNGVRVLRASLHPRKSGAYHRIMNYLSFWRNGRKLADSLDSDFDVALGYQFSPVMQVDPAVRYCEKTGTPLLIYSFDLWPESLLMGGFSKNSAAFSWMRSVSRRIYESADALAVTSPLFEAYFREELDIAKDTVCLPQYAEDVFLAADAPQPDGYDDEFVNLTFAGNVGAAQSVQTIVKAAALLKDDPFAFHIVGSGSELDACKTLADQLGAGNVTFHGRHPLDEMPSYYAASDAMVATFADNPVLGYTLPRKVQSYMAAGKPVVGTLVGEARRVVEDAQCGLCCDAEDAEGLADCCRRLVAMSADERRALGYSARSYYEQHFSKNCFFETLEFELDKLKGTKHGC